MMHLEGTDVYFVVERRDYKKPSFSISLTPSAALRPLLFAGANDNVAL